MAVCEIADEGRVRTIRLNRPEKKNALSNELAWAVVTAVEEAARDDGVWVIAITGTGDAFCSGLDLSGSDSDASPLSPQSRCRRRLDISMKRRGDDDLAKGSAGIIQ